MTLPARQFRMLKMQVWTPAGPLEDRGGHSGFPHALPPPQGPAAHDTGGLRLHLELARLGLLRGFDQLLCLEGLTGVEHLPHQIETVRKVLRHFRGRVLLADEVGWARPSRPACCCASTCCAGWSGGC